MCTATAIACPNIAFIKYWGNRNDQLRIPSNGSISMNLDGLYTRTRVTFLSDLPQDELLLDDQKLTGLPLTRVSEHLNHIRTLAGIKTKARVESSNNFPMGTGIASSASAFAALTLAAIKAIGLDLNESELSRLARKGSGSACRSIPGGFVEWLAGENDQESYAYSFATPEYWDLVDCIAIISQNPKSVSSQDGQKISYTSPLQSARIEDASRRLDLCRNAILNRDFEALADVIELDSNMMHAVIMTSNPSLLYWQPATLAIIQSVKKWRRDGIPVSYTIDAGPNVHVICPSNIAEKIAILISQIPRVIRVIKAHPGSPAYYVSE
jgi:diphosphomevalonate decarboxylase